MDGFFPQLGWRVARYRWLVVGLWLALFIGSIPLVKNVTGALRSGGFEVPDSDSGKGAQILEQDFGRRTVTTGVAVFASDRYTVDDPTYRDAVTGSLNRIAQIDGVKEIFSYYSGGQQRFVSSDRRSTYALISFSTDEEQAKKLTPTVRAELDEQPEGIDANLMGFPALSYDLAKGSEHDLKKAELTSLPLTLLLLVLVFGTILAAGLPLVLGAMAVVISLAGIYLIAQKQDTSIFAMNTASMIGLGLGIDFSLLMVSRFREELERGLSPSQASANTVSTAGRSIVFSGLTVMLGLSVLCLYDLVLIRSIAIGMLLVAGIAMLGAVTLLPALLTLFGHSLNSYRIFGRKRRGAGMTATEGGRWHDWSLTVMRRPWLFLALSAGLLLVLALPARELNAIGSGGARGMPPEYETRQAYEALVAGFGPGEATPITVVVSGNRDESAWEQATLEAVYRLVKGIEADPRVQRVESLVGLVPPGTTEAQFKQLRPEAFQQNPQAQAALPAVVNVPRPGDTTSERRSNTHSIVVYSKTDELHEDTIQLVKDLRANIIPSVTYPPRSEVHTTGQTALILDYRDKLFGQFPMLVGLVLLVTYVVLLLFFHSLILPLKAILMNVLAILASYGVLVLVFQRGIGEQLLDFEALGRLSMFSPVILFSILFGLSTDYEVFLLSRVKELYAHTRDNERSVAMGLERTAGIITAAGLIMIVVFGSFALGDTLVIKELGVGLAVAVLLDSTIVRIMLVPASMKLMGSANWWMPKFLDWIPTIKESAEEPEGVAGAYGGAHAQVAVAGGPCPVCWANTRPNARFCGRCGASLGVPASAPALAIGDGQTIADWRMASPQQGAVAAPVAGAPPSAGVRRMPVMLSNGQRRQRAWLVLRDCQVEDAPRRGEVPTLQIEGVDLAPLSGTDPEIQIRNARIRL